MADEEKIETTEEETPEAEECLTPRCRDTVAAEAEAA